MTPAMSKKKPDNKDRHLPYKAVRIPLDLYNQLVAIAQRNDRPTSREVIRAIRNHIEANRPPTE